MEVFDVIKTRTATRGYLEKDILEGDVRDILEAGRLSPSAGNSQPWEFILIDERDDLEELASLSTSGSHIAESAVSIVVTVREGSWSRFDAGRAIQNMVLLAWSRGIASGMAGGWKDEAYDYLGIPEGWEIVAAVTFGHPKYADRKGVKDRKPFEEVVAYRRFDQSYEP